MKTPFLMLLAAAVAAAPAFAMDPKRAAMHMDQDEKYWGKKEAQPEPAKEEPADGMQDTQDVMEEAPSSGPDMGDGMPQEDDGGSPDEDR